MQGNTPIDTRRPGNHPNDLDWDSRPRIDGVKIPKPRPEVIEKPPRDPKIHVKPR